jgi:hypothetical protein
MVLAIFFGDLDIIRGEVDIERDQVAARADDRCPGGYCNGTFIERHILSGKVYHHHDLLAGTGGGTGWASKNC